MINNVTLVGRLTKDIDLKKTTSNISTCTFTLACDKKYQKQGEERQADFIQCVAWRQSADFLSQYAHKGDVVAIEGSIQTRNYDGQYGKVYVTEVVCDRVSLVGTKKKDSLESKAQEFARDNNIEYQEDNFANDPKVKIDTDDLPFI